MKMNPKFSPHLKRLIAILVCFFGIFTGNILSQTYNWSSVPFDVQLVTFMNSQFGYDIEYDNYGLNFVGIRQESGAQHLANYYLVDNNGNKIDEALNFAGSNINGATIGCHKGKVYVVTVSGNTFKLFTKTNGVSAFQYITSFTPPDYENNPSGYYINMDIAFTDNYAYVVWDRTTYPFPNTGSIGAFRFELSNYGFLRFDPVDKVLQFGSLPKMAVSDNKIHIAYKKSGGTSDPPRYVIRNIANANDGNPAYEGDGQFVEGWDESPFGAYSGTSYCNLIYCETDAHLYLTANLTYNSPTGISMDTKFKRTTLTGGWGANPITVKINNGNLFKYPPVFYDKTNKKVNFAYSSFQAAPFTSYARYREYNTLTGQLEAENTLDNNNVENYFGGSSSSGSKGDFITYSYGEYTGIYKAFRNPRAITGNITYNTLLTGSEYINAPASPWCHTNGADIEALNNSNTTIKQNTRVFIDANDYIKFKQGSCVVFEPNAEIFPNPGPVYYETNCITWGNTACNRTYPGGRIEVSDNLNFPLNNGAFFVIDGNSTLKIGTNSALNISGSGSFLKLLPQSVVDLAPGADIVCANGSYIEADGSTINGSSSAITIPPGTELKIKGNVSINNTAINIQSGGKLTIDNNAVLNLSGTASFNIISSGAIVTIGSNASINVNNRAALQATNINFTSSAWNGITFNNANCILNGCTFSNAPNALRFYNTAIGAAIPKGIRNCTFNVPANGQGIYAENIYRFIADGNTFNLSGGAWGLFTRNYISDNPESIESAPIYDLKVINNTFSNGLYQAFLWAGTSSYLPFYVYNNTFNGTCTYNLAGRRIGGDIKNNRINGNSTGIGIALWEANPNVFGNVMTTAGNTMLLNSAYPNLAPVRNSNNQLVWYGGKNTLTSSQNDNIYISLGYPITNLGLNSFTIQNASKYHIEGYLPDSVQQYYWCLNNCWVGNGTIPKTNLRRVSSTAIVPPNYLTLSCRFDHITLNEDIDSLGDSIYDTVEVTDDLSGSSAGDDEVLYSQGQEYEDNDNYPEAINQYKTLVNLYPASLYANTALYSLYDCYEALDTSGMAEMSDELFGDLRLYLNQKIESDSYNSQFVDAAYNLVLSCEAQMKNLEIALTGYEFIATYHPDPETRLLASMDYSDIEAMMSGGEGGGESGSKNSPENTEDDKKPILDVVKKAYKKIEKKIELKAERLSKENKTDLTERISSNLQSRGLTQEQKSEQNLKNFTLLSRLSIGELNQDESEKIIPRKYQLSQNYPNPFNPVTTINYDLPKDGLLRLKVYDITGKEILTLVNEFKAAGSYQVQFDGTKFSSGVYFYRIEAGLFVETKRMVLVK